MWLVSHVDLKDSEFVARDYIQLFKIEQNIKAEEDFVINSVFTDISQILITDAIMRHCVVCNWSHWVLGKNRDLIDFAPIWST